MTKKDRNGRVIKENDVLWSKSDNEYATVEKNEDGELTLVSKFGGYGEEIELLEDVATSFYEVVEDTGNLRNNFLKNSPFNENKETVDSVTEYLNNYKPTNSTQMDERLHIFKADVYVMSQELKKGELHIYSRKDYIHNLRELIEDNIFTSYGNYLAQGYDEAEAGVEAENDEIENKAKLAEVVDSEAKIFIESTNSEGYMAI